MAIEDLAHPRDEFARRRRRLRALAQFEIAGAVLSLVASSAPSARSRITTCGPPGASRSFEPWMTAQSAPRLSAYLSWALRPPAPR